MTDSPASAPAQLSRDAIAAVDSTGQLADVLSLPEHLRDALWRVESANLKPVDCPGGLVVAGMGGSAVGGVLARAVLGDRCSRPMAVARGYGLPSWATPDTAVLCSSYSGETEETLAAYEAAGALGAHRIVCTTGGRLARDARADGVPVIPLPGGFQPRAAVGYSLVVALEVAALVGTGDPLHTEIDVAAVSAERLVAEWGPDAPEESLAKRLARSLHGTTPQIAGAGLTRPSPTAGRPSSTRTPSRPPSPPSSPSLTTTSSSAGRAPRISAASAPCSSTTATCTPACASASGSRRS